MRRPADLTTSKWTDPPHNRWGLWQVRELTRTARIPRGNDPVTVLPPHWVSLDDLIGTHVGGEYTWRQFLEDTSSDALVVRRLVSRTPYR